MRLDNGTLLRLWRLQPFNPSPLMRGSDRCQALLHLVVIALMLLTIPVAGALGTTSYTRTAEQIRTEAAVKVSVPGIVSGSPHQIPGTSPYRPARFEAPVRWDRDGRTESGTIAVDATAVLGSRVQVWLGADGKPSDPPARPGTAAGTGIATALSALIIGWGGALALEWCVAWLLNGLRAARWDAEWRMISRPIGT